MEEPNTDLVMQWGRSALHRIVDKIAEETGIERTAIMGGRRTKGAVRARQLAMKVAYDYTPLSLPDVGRFFHRDHTTVLHAIRAVDKWADQGTRILAQSVADAVLMQRNSAL